MAMNVPANQNVAPHEGDLKATFESAPEITLEEQAKIEILNSARERVLEKLFGITFILSTPAKTIQILDARRHPEEYKKPSALLDEKFEAANDNSALQEQQQAA